MRPYELAKLIHRELSPLCPKLSAAINRALVEIGEGSVLVGLGPGTHESDNISFQESEVIPVSVGDESYILSRIHAMMENLETHTSWRVIVDKKSTKPGAPLELLYTLVRTKEEW
ncbi:hypothetical protein LJC71_05830 [Desulfosarcina sp. OttesenSCG-928-A07]|nr:hypothetical protein [Desulfosarcina sp. OttesenSCG-928-G17]MDL2329248.1 hypothetical protein [Desulfosarcina sp. OttesenSCG-928-A07]